MPTEYCNFRRMTPQTRGVRAEIKHIMVGLAKAAASPVSVSSDKTPFPSRDQPKGQALNSVTMHNVIKPPEIESEGQRDER